MKELKRRITKLERENKHREIYALLKQLEAWEVQEVIDVTSEDRTVNDVDSFIFDVLLLGVVESGPGLVPVSLDNGQATRAYTWNSGPAFDPAPEMSPPEREQETNIKDMVDIKGEADT